VSEVRIESERLRKALKQISLTVKIKDETPLDLWTEGGRMHLVLPTMRTSIGVDGNLGAALRLNASVFVRLHQAMPKGDPLRLRIEGDRLEFGSFAISGKVIPKPDPALSIAPTTPRTPERLRDWLRDRFRTASSETERQRRFEQLAIFGRTQDLIDLGLLKSAEPILTDYRARLKRAASALKPYGIEPQEIETLVVRTMSARFIGEMEGERPQ
jgi:hypothetical protein